MRADPRGHGTLAGLIIIAALVVLGSIAQADQESAPPAGGDGDLRHRLARDGAQRFDGARKAGRRRSSRNSRAVSDTG